MPKSKKHGQPGHSLTSKPPSTTTPLNRVGARNLSSSNVGAVSKSEDKPCFTPTKINRLKGDESIQTTSEQIAYILPITRLWEQGMLYALSGFLLLNFNVDWGMFAIETAIACVVLACMTFMQKYPRARAATAVGYSMFAFYQNPILTTVDIAVNAAILTFESKLGFRLPLLLKTFLSALLHVLYRVSNIQTRPPLPDTGRIIALPDPNHNDLELGRQILAEIPFISPCHQSTPDVPRHVFIAEGDCLKTDAGDYVNLFDLSWYSTKQGNQQIASLTFPKAHTTVCTYSFLGPRIESNAYKFKYIQVMKQFLTLTQMLEKHCQQFTDGSRCSTSPSLALDEATLSRYSLFQLSSMAVQIQTTMDNVFVQLQQAPSYLEDFLKDNIDLVTNLFELIKTGSEIANQYTQSFLKEGDVAAIKAINSTIDKVREGFDLIILIGSDHLKEGTDLWNYLRTLREEGFAVFQKAVNEELRPLLKL